MKTDQKISLRRHPSLWMGIALVSLIVLMGIVSFFYLPFDPTEVSEQRLSAPSAIHIFGTDDFGRDVFSRMLSGAGICLLVGIVSVSIGALIGVPLGIYAAQRGGWPAKIIERGLDILYAFPALLLAILLAAARGSGSTWTAMVAIGIASVPAFARYFGGNVAGLYGGGQGSRNSPLPLNLYPRLTQYYADNNRAGLGEFRPRDFGGGRPILSGIRNPPRHSHLGVDAI